MTGGEELLRAKAGLSARINTMLQGLSDLAFRETESLCPAIMIVQGFFRIGKGQERRRAIKALMGELKLLQEDIQRCRSLEELSLLRATVDEKEREYQKLLV